MASHEDENQPNRIALVSNRRAGNSIEIIVTDDNWNALKFSEMEVRESTYVGIFDKVRVTLTVERAFPGQ